MGCAHGHCLWCPVRRCGDGNNYPPVELDHPTTVLASAVRVPIPLPPRSDRRERSREGIQHPHGSQTRSPPRLFPLAGRADSAMLATFLAAFKRNKKRAPPVVAECPTDRSGTLRTTREGKPPAESGAAVSTADASSDTETGSPDLNKRGPSRPERGRSGWFTERRPRGRHRGGATRLTGIDTGKRAVRVGDNPGRARRRQRCRPSIEEPSCVCPQKTVYGSARPDTR